MSNRARSIVLAISLIYAGLATSEQTDTTSSVPAPDPAAPTPADRISLELHKNLAPVLVANVDGVNVRLQFDLGNSLQSNRLILGGKDFGPWRFEVWDISLPGFDGFIGHDFFATHVVCIDFPRNRVAIAR